MKHNKHGRRVWLFYSYDSATDKTTITNGSATTTYTGSNLAELVRLFKAQENITAPADLIRY